MKKLILLAVAVLMAVAASAVERGFRPGVRVDLGASNIIEDGDKTSFGYGAMFIAEYNHTNNLFFQSGLGLENIAHKEDLIGTLNAYYLHLPIHVGYRITVDPGTSLFFQAGPTFGVGLFGTDLNYGGYHLGNIFDALNRFDLMIGLRVGVEWNKFQFSIGTNYGILEAWDGGGHTLQANIGIGYMF